MKRKIFLLQTKNPLILVSGVPVKVGADESIVNAPLVCLQSKNTNNAKSEIRFKELIRNL
jgi:hypothetical protein